ncbi:hypothetical protein V496_10314, partial [Pseudogymnoascus sp. VKM F-4515 (FW-2607)]
VYLAALSDSGTVFCKSSVLLVQGTSVSTRRPFWPPTWPLFLNLNSYNRPIKKTCSKFQSGNVTAALSNGQTTTERHESGRREKKEQTQIVPKTLRPQERETDTLTVVDHPTLLTAYNWKTTTDEFHTPTTRIHPYIDGDTNQGKPQKDHRKTFKSRGWESDIPPLTLSIRPRDSRIPAEGLLYSSSPPPHSLSITTHSPNPGANNASLTSFFPLQPRPPAYPRPRPGFSTPTRLTNTTSRGGCSVCQRRHNPLNPPHIRYPTPTNETRTTNLQSGQARTIILNLHRQLLSEDEQTTTSDSLSLESQD